jgi:hypothetical protein
MSPRDDEPTEVREEHERTLPPAPEPDPPEPPVDPPSVEPRPDELPKEARPKRRRNRYADEASRLPVVEVEGPPEPVYGSDQRVLETHISTFGARTVEVLRAPLLELLGKKRASILDDLVISHAGDVPRRFQESEYGGYYIPAHTVWKITVSQRVAIPGHQLLAHIEDGVVTTFGRGKQAVITQHDYDRAKANTCDVCKTKRRRTHVYVVERQADGKHVLVGGECATKFQGTNLAAAAGRLDEISAFLREMEGAEAGEMGIGDPAGRSSHYFDPRQIAAYGLAACTLTGGYEKGGEDGGTKAKALDLMVAEAKKTLSDEHKAVLKDARKKVYEDWDRLKEWLVESKRAAEEKGGFSEFHASLHALAHAEAIHLKQTGRVTWMVWAYYQDQIKKRERALIGDKEARAYAGSKEMHDLPGEWEVVSSRPRKTEWGETTSIVAVNRETGEKIWFPIQMGSTAWHEAGGHPDVGAVLRLRGKVKGKSDDGKLAFLANVSPGKTTEEKKAKKESQKQAAKQRKVTLEKWTAKLSEPDAWKLNPADEWYKDQEEISRQGVDKLDELHEQRVVAELREGNHEALRWFTDQTHYDRRTQFGDETVRNLLHVATAGLGEKTNPEYRPTKEQADQAIQQWPAFAEHLRRARIKNPERERLIREASDRGMAARDADRKMLKEKKLREYMTARERKAAGVPPVGDKPIELGINLTGLDVDATYGETPAFNADRISTADGQELLRRVDDMSATLYHEASDAKAAGIDSGYMPRARIDDREVNRVNAFQREVERYLQGDIPARYTPADKGGWREMLARYSKDAVEHHRATAEGFERQAGRWEEERARAKAKWDETGHEPMSEEQREVRRAVLQKQASENDAAFHRRVADLMEAMGTWVGSLPVSKT